MGVIGISGKINSGKDLVGSIMIEILKGNWQIKKFADPLKDIVCIILGCTREDLENKEFKETPLGEEWLKTIDNFDEWGFKKETPIKEILTPRKILQLLGTECGRHIIHKDIWINALFKDYDDNNWVELSDGAKYINSNWIITDVRFLNEAKYIKDKGGLLIRINRNVETNNHSSETILDDYKEFDYVINNTGTKEHLQKEVMKCLSYLIG